jgi:hypothetical protein
VLQIINFNTSLYFIFVVQFWTITTESLSVTEGPLSGATCPRFFMQKYAVYWPEGGADSQYSVFIGQKMSLTG